MPRRSWPAVACSSSPRKKSRDHIRALCFRQWRTKAEAMAYKIPESVLVVVHTRALDVLLLQRAAQPEFWQSVTGSREPGDADLHATARRELLEETGLSDGELSDWKLTNRYEIWPQW